MARQTIYPSPMKAICSTCTERYLKTKGWDLDQCPVCFVSGMHHGYGYIPGTDAVFWSKTNTFFVVRVPQGMGKYKLSAYTPDQYKLYQRRVPDAQRYVFSGTLDQCLAYIKGR